MTNNSMCNVSVCDRMQRCTTHVWDLSDGMCEQWLTHHLTTYLVYILSSLIFFTIPILGLLVGFPVGESLCTCTMICPGMDVLAVLLHRRRFGFGLPVFDRCDLSLCARLGFGSGLHKGIGLGLGLGLGLVLVQPPCPLLGRVQGLRQHAVGNRWQHKRVVELVQVFRQVCKHNSVGLHEDSTK